MSVTIEAFGSTSLVADGSHYFLQPNGGSAVELSNGGSPVVAGQYGQWAPIAANQTASGYQVVWKLTGADQYLAWNTDSSGNCVSGALDPTSGTSAALQAMEVSFQQDLNGDGSIGNGDGSTGAPPPSSSTVIEAFGSTSLVADGSHYFLQPNGGSAVELSNGGSPVVAGQYGQWAPIAANQTASGYQVVWKLTGADQYLAWNTDSSGNCVSGALNPTSGTSTALKAMEVSFQQDLNGDGSIGNGDGSTGASSAPHFVYQGVDSDGAQIYDVTWDTPGSQPFAVRVLTPDHPSTSYSHTFLYALPVEAGLAQLGFGSGLDELQKLGVQNQCNATIIEPIFPINSWYADSSIDATMNYETFMSTILPAWVDSTFDPSGTDKNLLIGFSKSGYGALDLLFKHPSVFADAAAWDFPADMAYNTWAPTNYGTETNFDANYELTGTFIDTLKAPFTTEDRIWISEGSLYSAAVANFDALLSSHGVLHTTTQAFDGHSWFGGWLSDAVAGLYGLVNDSTGAPPPGGGSTGAPPPSSSTVIEAFGSTSLVEDGSHYFLQPNGGSAVELSNGGSPVVAGQYGQWAPIAANQTASGYQVVWKLTGADQYLAWNTDNSGNCVSGALDPASGTSTALKAMEVSFQQDLNGDGSIGNGDGSTGAPPPSSSTVIEAFGSTSLVEDGSHYFLQPNGGSAVELSNGGSPVVAGQYGQWAPIAANQTASGYQVVWKLTGADQYLAWNTDSSGNCVSGALDPASGTSTALKAMEVSFQQDLNGDGSIGNGDGSTGAPPPSSSTVIEAFGSTSLVEDGSHYFLQPNGGSAVELSNGGSPVVAGQYGQWAPIAANQTASGYQVVWKLTGADQYLAWNTDSSGNCVSGALDPASGTSTALKAMEVSFQQDLNGDGLVGSPTIGTGETLEVVSAYSGQVSFTASTGILELLNSSSFVGTVAGMSGQDTIDFGDIDPTKVQQPSYNGNTSGGTLHVTDGTNSGNIALLGNYMASVFVAGSDGHGGTSVVDPPALGGVQPLVSPPHA